MLVYMEYNNDAYDPFEISIGDSNVYNIQYQHTKNNKEGYRSSGERRSKGDIQTGYVYLKRK